MPLIKQFKLPDLGEGLTEGEILKWLVQPGDTVRLNQPIVEVETAKAAVELPSPYAGIVTELLHGEGDTVDVGAPIISFETEGSEQEPEPAAEAETEQESEGAKDASPNGYSDAVDPLTADPQTMQTLTNGDPAARSLIADDLAAANPVESVEQAVDPEAVVDTPPPDAAVEPGLIGGPAPGGRTSVLVGYGPKSTTAKRRERKAPPATTGDVATEAVSTSDLVPPPARVSAAEVGAAAQRRADEVPVLAKPPVRKLARDLGVDLHAVAPSGPGGTITRSDVESASEAPAEPEVEAAVAAAPDFDPASREQRIPVKGVRKHTAAAMSASAFTAPHVTEFVTVDVTRAMRAIGRLRQMDGYSGVRVSPLLLVAKGLLLAVGRHPMINSSWDEAAQEIVVKDYVNLGIAAATPRGLIVPNIKDAGRLSLRELAEAMTALVGTARGGKTAPADMQGGTITITNVGVFGVDTGTPILNPGESAILAFGAIREQPWVHKGKVKPRMVTTLALSFDHRVIDGELGSLFLADLAAVLRDPEAALLAWT
ncbi:MAG: 2-oxo acid dehydrogenase subunit E2 [Actinomycetota bacterium]|nr:2-oxo acid dehydrogenase subunit E2 [Actinomycetota bacterium]